MTRLPGPWQLAVLYNVCTPEKVEAAFSARIRSRISNFCENNAHDLLRMVADLQDRHVVLELD